MGASRAQRRIMPRVSPNSARVFALKLIASWLLRDANDTPSVARSMSRNTSRNMSRYLFRWYLTILEEFL